MNLSRSRGCRAARGLFFEELESRAMLAVASLSGGVLKIVGNNTAENVRVTAGAVPGQFFVSGVSGFAGPFNGVTGIAADLKGGNDFFKVGTSDEPAELLGNIVVKLGNGSDQCNIRANTLGAVIIDGGLQYTPGSQDDVVDVANSILGSLVVDLWAGNDALYISDSAILTLTANLGVPTLIPGQVDSDGVSIERSAIGSAVITLGTAGGGAANGNSEIQVYNANAVYISSTVFNTLSITGGNKTDEIYIGSTQECGIGQQLRVGLVDLVDDLEGLIPRGQLATVLSGMDTILANLAAASELELGGFSLGSLRNVDLSDALDAYFSHLEEQGLDFCDIGAQSTVVTSLAIVTLGGNDYVSLGQGLFGAEAAPTLQGLTEAALSADLRILGSATIETGGGHDCVELFDVFVGTTLTVSLGAGNDCLCLFDVTSAIAIFLGGAGFDEILFDFDGLRDPATGYLSYTQLQFEFQGACFDDVD